MPVSDSTWRRSKLRSSAVIERWLACLNCRCVRLRCMCCICGTIPCTLVIVNPCRVFRLCRVESFDGRFQGKVHEISASFRQTLDSGGRSQVNMALEPNRKAMTGRVPERWRSESGRQVRAHTRRSVEKDP